MSTISQLTPVKSSRLAAIGYDEDNFLLFIKFPATKKAPAGKTYAYENFSPEQFDEFQRAESFGVYFGQHILNNSDHPCKCVDEGNGERARAIEELHPKIVSGELSAPPPIPEGAACEEASPFSGNMYVACGKPATAIVNNGDQRDYFMCDECTSHNLHNRGGVLLAFKSGTIAEWLAKEQDCKAEVLVPAQTYEPSVAVPEDTIPELPTDEAGLKARALEVKTQATALSITTGQACEEASRRVLIVRAERKLATAIPLRIKEAAHKAWKLASDYFNEIDGFYASAERYYDDGIIQFRAQERRRVEAEAARIRQAEEARIAEENRKNAEEHARRMREAQEDADRQAKLLADQDAAAARTQGQPEDIVEQIRANPLPVAPAYVEPPPAPISHAPAVVRTEVPKVQGLGFVTDWTYEITNASLIPLSHDFYTLDEKKIAARVKTMKQHANIPGVRVFSQERTSKRTGSK